MAGFLEVKKEWKCFGGTLKQLTHQSEAVGTPMRFSIFLPPQAESSPVPVLYYLSGLTCTDENFTQKGGAYRLASKLGIAVVAPDTSPRGAGIEGEDSGWDFGTGAGFYLNALQPGWKDHYRMYDYITKELVEIVCSNFPVDPNRKSITGHSMGGHGALTIAFKNPSAYKSVSAFAPICHPINCPWGDKAFTGYLGTDKELWKEYDATILMKEKGPFPSFSDILIDQGAADDFLAANQLQPEALQAACAEKNQKVSVRMQEGYDHSYFFIASFMEDHIQFHADALHS
uniref:S-formylglutathione hydrolase n=1 Tax=Fibrocapsa japonica TaxID=94617 RepID=A0A7S2UZ85_9STRA|mmetsp:Transcript_21637/g.31383  ORF Transcript_21637/g.31383 Transcript_21637/m.31383 type:complete len:287 (+) Transcript_21637:63-923(+)